MLHSPRALALRAAAVLTALATALLVGGDLATLHNRARDLGPVLHVSVATRDLPLGTTVVASDVRTVDRYESQVPRGALTRRADAVGRVVAVPVLRGSTLRSGHLAPADRRGLDGLVPAGRRAVRIADESGLRPGPGTSVDVLVTLDPGLVFAGAGDETTRVVARGARVLASGPGARGDADPALGDGVVLLVSTAEAERLAFAEANGFVTLAITPPEDACCRTSSSGSSRG